MSATHKKIAQVSVRPTASLNLLSRQEIQALQKHSHKIHRLFRRCALAVLNTGAETDDGAALVDAFADFDIQVERSPRGLRLKLSNVPASAFVDGKIIEGIREHLSVVLRDIIFYQTRTHPLNTSTQISDDVFSILRHANIVRSNERPNLVVCWGGHSIPRHEYDFTKEVGYELGLRGLDIATGCGIGAMKGPMKGAKISHAKQKQYQRRYIGITEPGIIASEAPNPIVNELVILPDIEKRLEAFVRLAHCIIVFPGGAGTMEEILYLLGLLMHQDNQQRPLGLIFACDKRSQSYFRDIDNFLVACFGDSIRQFYQIIIGNPEEIAQKAKKIVRREHQLRRRQREAYSFNWFLQIPYAFQQPFVPTHESMATLNLHLHQEKKQLALNLRAAFSGIVAGNIKEETLRLIKNHGPFHLSGNAELVSQIDTLLNSFINDGRMKLDGKYKPCYTLSSQIQ